jgi:hypothetical protein
VLGGEYFKYLWPDKERADFDSAADFWRHGGDLFFGKKMSAEVLAGYSPASELGRLLCGCEPSAAKLEGKSRILPELVYGISQWELLLQLVSLVPESVKKLGVPAIQHGKATLYVPDFLQADVDLNSGVIRLIRKIALGGKPVLQHGWLTPYLGFDYDHVKDLRDWISALRDYFLIYAPHREEFQHKEGCLSNGELREAHVASLREDKLEGLVQELVSRFFITTMLAGKWATEILPLPDRSTSHFLCCEKHGAPVLNQRDYDMLSDEGDDE